MDNNFNKIVSALKQKRQEIASLKKIEVFKILQNKTIEEIAQVRPQTVEELAKIKGIGEQKLLHYGQMILSIVKQFSGGRGNNLAFFPEPSDKSSDIESSDIASPKIKKISLQEIYDKPEGSNFERPLKTRVFSVGEFLAHLNGLLSTREYAVQGEITQLKGSSYSIYFSLKDKKDGSVVNCYMSQWKYDALSVPVTEGMEVKLTGYPEIYKLSGRLSLVVSNIEPIGEGALRKAYELLKKKLEAEGLFNRKRPLPEFIERIGVISSKSGVVIQDFRKNLKNRGFEIDFYDARMEGSEAPRMIVSGIKTFNKLKPDLLVIMRGGGSLESMQAFNNENVVRAIFASEVPVLCGIGHDVDVPIASMVADLAVSTPTATAHRVNQSWDKLEEGLPILSQGLLNKFERLLTKNLNFVAGISQELGGQVERLSQRITSASEEILSYFGNVLENIKQKISHAEKILSALNPENQLKLGYSIIFDQSGKIVKNIDSIKIGDMIKARLQKGILEVEVKNKK